MSYSIGATRATKSELELAIRDELAKVPETQPVHTRDIDPAFKAAKSLIDLMEDSPSRDLHCGVSGSIWITEPGIQTVNLSINVSHQDRT